MMVTGLKMTGIGGGFRILSDLRELSLGGPCGPCFLCTFMLISLRKHKVINSLSV